jgi:hypothetical protein
MNCLLAAAGMLPRSFGMLKYWMIGGGTASTERLMLQDFPGYRGMVRNWRQYRARFRPGAVIMDDMERLSLLIGDIYDASLDPALWPSVFRETCGYVGGSAVCLHSQDIVGKKSNLYFASGYEAKFEQLYMEINPIFPTATFFDVERSLTLTDCLPREEFCRTQFARELVAGYCLAP